MTAETDVIKMAFKRIPKGLLVTVKTDPVIEDFMRGLGDGMDTLDVGEYGRQWTPFMPEQELKVYGLPPEDNLIGWIRNGNGPSYRLDRVAGRMCENNGDDRVMGVNLSFLRLMGTSQEGGTSFIVSGVYSGDAVLDFKKTFADAAEGFYKNFLKPVDVQIIISTTHT